MVCRRKRKSKSLRQKIGHLEFCPQLGHDEKSNQFQ